MSKEPLHAGERTTPATEIPRVLVVDEDVAQLQLIKLILLRENFTCELILCEGRDKAFEYLNQEVVDLILLEVKMPGDEAFAFLEALKGRPGSADTSVIFLTSSQETDFVVKAFERGASDYIAKPINSAVLTARMQSILQRKALERQLKARNRELEETNRLKDELLLVCSHDLRSPLAAIEVFGQLLKGEGRKESVPSDLNLVTRIINQSRMARRLVDNLLNYQKFEAGRLVPESSFFSAREMLRSCCEDEQAFVHVKEIGFQMELPAHEILCFGDRDLLAQGVRNVLGNAIKFTESKVSLIARVVDFDKARGGKLQVRITDDGPGIPPHQEQWIFEKYTKHDSNRGGSGLGLYISRNLLEMHGGSIAVKSRNGTTTFTLTIPFAFAAHQLPELSDFSEARVLVISTSQPTALLLEGILLEGGLVYVSKTLAERTPVEILEQTSPDIVVADLQASGLNLYRLARIINAAPPEIRWIFLGKDRDVSAFGKLLEKPFSHLPVPVNPLPYLRMVRDLMRAQQPEKATVAL